MRASQYFFVLMAVLVVTFPACMSTQSTLLHRDETNQWWQRKGKLKGVPITLKVPTHIKVEVLEHHYLTNITPSGGGGTETGNLEFVELNTPIRSVKTELIETEKVFTVDPKRPAAGSLNASIKFDGQYFDDIDYDVSDETIADLTNLIGNVARGGLFGNPTTSGEEVDKRIQQIDSHVASAMFALDSPTVELEIQQFLTKHISGCHTCNVVAPGGPFHSDVVDASSTPDDDQ